MASYFEYHSVPIQILDNFYYAILRTLQFISNTYSGAGSWPIWYPLSSRFCLLTCWLGLVKSCSSCCPDLRHLLPSITIAIHFFAMSLSSSSPLKLPEPRWSAHHDALPPMLVLSAAVSLGKEQKLISLKILLTLLKQRYSISTSQQSHLQLKFMFWKCEHSWICPFCPLLKYFLSRGISMNLCFLFANFFFASLGINRDSFLLDLLEYFLSINSPSLSTPHPIREFFKYSLPFLDSTQPLRNSLSMLIVHKFLHLLEKLSKHELLHDSPLCI